MAKLKVFTWSDGFHAFSVATTSKPRALQAWGIGSDIFKTGLASEITFGSDYEAALASPGEVIERGLSIDVDKISKTAKPKAKPASDKAREALEALQADLAVLDREQTAAKADLHTRRAALEAEARSMSQGHDQARKALMNRIRAARTKL